MVDPLLVDGETITALEEQWTGYPRRTTFCQSFPATFFTAIGFVTYLDEDWHLVRELQILALENDEMVLRRILGVVQNLHPFPALRATMLQALKDMYAGTSSDILREAIVRRCFVLVPKRRCGESADTPFPGLYITGILDDGRLCGCTHNIFRAFRGDYADPEYLFLRYSRRTDAQDRLHNKHGLPMRWLPFSTILSQASNLWVHSYSRWDQPRMCLYFLNQDPTAIPYSELEERAAWTFEALDVFHTVRGCDPRDFTAFETGIQWNLKKTVGISLPSITDFPKLKRLPTLFGCRGIGLTSGQLVYYRTLEPWLDPRLSVPDSEDRHFLQYKIVMQHTLHWMTTAQKRLDEGTACCLWAGFIKALPICNWCQNGLWNSIELSRELLCLSVTFSVLSEHLAPHVGTVFDILRSYPRIDDPFEDLGHLQRQYHEFRLWRAGEREEGIRRRGKGRLFEVQ
ncbi:hypothetical protein FALBO_14893 [Fusarium albosuccineum]|uniref:Uncharacterized protein n=1 Tax=Fusarium albosuccineum TaxID=1237068 RepID=A0A8H4KX82_9HYPO|nr:hypothetical protein FALBO_14893 [Fusarium albosuccineum]